MQPRIVVVGTGYLGTTHAACMAELGFEVLGVDVDPAKVQRLTDGDVPFFEPGLRELVQRQLASGGLQFSASPSEAAQFGDVFFLCVGTPQRADGLAADVGQLHSAVAELAPQLSRSALLVGKSTVPVGTARSLAEVARSRAPAGVDVEVAWNPEFLREGHAVGDTLRPDRVVLGVTSTEAEKVLREVYARLLDDGVPLVVTDLETAELVKASANAFLATKISFINAVAELSEVVGADVLALAEALGYDERIGRSFLSPGLGFGGGCLPKDVRALMARAGELGVDQALTFLREVDLINTGRRRRMVELAVEECGGSALGRRVAVLGAAFKPFTDDVRDSPALHVAAQLQVQGAELRVYDPHANVNASRVFPTMHYADTAREAIRGADLLLHLTEWPEFADLDPVEIRELVAEPRILDGRSTLDAERWLAAGWRFRTLGRRLHLRSDRGDERR